MLSIIAFKYECTCYNIYLNVYFILFMFNTLKYNLFLIFNYLTWTSTQIGKWKLIDPGSKKKPANIIDIKFLIVWPSHFKSCY